MRSDIITKYKSMFGTKKFSVNGKVIETKEEWQEFWKQYYELKVIHALTGTKGRFKKDA